MFLKLNGSSVTGVTSSVTVMTLANVTTNGTILSENNSELLRQTYDSYGAMLFIAVVICFYASSILLFICWNQRWNEAHDDDRQISQYLKSAKALETKIAKDYVLKFRSMLLASSVIAHGNRMMGSRNCRLIKPLLGPRESDVGLHDTGEAEDAEDATHNASDHLYNSNCNADPCDVDDHQCILHCYHQDINSQSHDIVCDYVSDNDRDDSDDDDNNEDKHHGLDDELENEVGHRMDN
ncbi:hypothetical protein LOTGIDRAFT_171832 [Lottia gigantea]|uniref:Uncharacterized protein n=1 Tax=Lottia gigantea TaxID=225164 RepID=V4B540_LOTGI|nr:hypothetical protein LOTGIDRAFT_171832 [Lottia gigantea]ESP02631.1 hypothetical protein LOTGIDRAFT_171832 [Lottia gigantea]